MRRLFPTALTTHISGLDWGLLAGMLAVTQNRFFAGKLLGVLLLAVFTPALRWLGRPGVQRFYLGMAAWTIVQWAAIVRDYSSAYTIVAAYATGYWLLMAIVAAALRGSVEDDGNLKSSKTLDAAFVVVAGLSLVTLVSTAVQAGTLNPFQGAYEPVFGMSSGDHVTGLFGFHLFHVQLGDYSSVNGAVLALFAIFYVGGARWGRAVAAFVLMLFTASNFLTLATLAAAGVLAVLRWQRRYFLAAISGVAITLLFYAIITPKNLRYLATEISEKAPQIFPERAAEVSPASPVVRQRPQSEQATVAQKQQAGFNPDAEPGKLRAFRQTGAMMGKSARHLLAGAGPGRFSSGLALLAAAPAAGKGRLHAPLHFESLEFQRGHGRIVAAVKAMHPRYHTLSQMPYSWYNQLAGEYGLIGIALFLGLYVVATLRAQRGAAGAAMLFALLLILLSDYTFEVMSVVPFFEWMLWTSRQTGRSGEVTTNRLTPPDRA